MLLAFTDLIGRFHPVLVHLPIGILLLACFFQWLTLTSRFAMLQSSIPVMLFWGMLGAIISCISGYLLSQTGDYDSALVGKHQWLGIVTAIVSLVLYLAHQLSIGPWAARWVSLALIIIIFITGHLGGTLTHGEGYLTGGWGSGQPKGASPVRPIPNIQEAILYNDLIQPILQSRCYGCHGTAKQKGQLRLDQQDFILKGGKDGKVLIPGKPDESKMIERLLLPLSEEDHMPPREKPQPSASEIALIQWWIKNGADFNKHVKEFAQDDKIKPVLASLQTGAPAAAPLTAIPAEPVVKADDALLERLRAAGVIILPVGQNSNYLSASFFTVMEGADSLIALLGPLKQQLVWLKLDGAKLNDKSMTTIESLTSLTRLQLSNTPVSDAGIAKLTSLQKLQSLNVVGTVVTAQGLMPLQKIKSLKDIYVYRSAVAEGDWPMLRKAFPGINIDSGKYTVPMLPTDTVEIKY